MHRIHKKKAPLSFYFIRHGQTDWGAGELLKGPQDLSLNNVGIEQAKKTGIILNQLLIDSPGAKMVSSSLKRAVETASEIEKATGIPISSVENGLKERYYGDYRSVTNISETPPDAESTEDFRKRVFQNLDKVFSEYHQACPLIIVSHQKVFEYVAELLSKRQESLTQGGIGHFIRNEDGTWQLDILDMAERAENRNTNIP